MISKNLFDKVGYYSILGLSFLLPWFFLPLRGLSVGVGKAFVFQIVVFLLAGFFIIWSVAQRKLIFSKSWIGLSMLLFSFLVVLSSLFSGDFFTAFLGEDFSVTDGLFLSALGLFGFFSTQVFRTYDRLLSLYFSLSLSFIIVAVFEWVRFIVGVDAFGVGALASSSASIVGRFNDLGIYAGLMFLLGLVGLDFLKLRQNYRWFLIAVLVLAVSVMFLVNISFVWLLVSVGTFLIFLYRTAFKEETQKQASRWRLPVVSLFAFVFVIFGYLFMGNMVQGLLSRVSMVGYNEIRLAPSATISTVADVWRDNFLTGSGPASFANTWYAHRPQEIASMEMSDYYFYSGFSSVMTWAGLLGLLGLLIVIFWLIRVLQIGVLTVAGSRSDYLQKFFSLSVVILALYLWAVLLIYAPGFLVHILTFLITGVLAGVVFGQNKSSEILSINLESKQSQKRIAFGILSLLVLLTLIGATYGLVQKQRSILAFRSSVYASDMQAGYEKALKALRAFESSTYARALSYLMLNQAVTLSSSEDISENESAKEQVEFLLGQAVSFADRSLSINENDYRNFMLYADVYNRISQFGVEDAYLLSRQAYENALNINPYAIDVRLRLGSLELSSANNENVQVIAEDILKIRPSSVDAYILLADLAFRQKDTDQADQYISRGAVVSGLDISKLVRVGLYAFQNNRFTLARDIFSASLQANPSSVDSAIGLMLSLEELGEKEEASALRKRLIEVGVLSEEMDNTNISSGAGDEFLPRDSVIAEESEDDYINTETLDSLGEPVEIDSVVDVSE